MAPPSVDQILDLVPPTVAITREPDQPDRGSGLQTSHERRYIAGGNARDEKIAITTPGLRR